MKIDIKLRCYPDSQLKQLIHQIAGNNRFIYNYFLNLKNTRYQENKTSLSYQDCYAVKREDQWICQYCKVKHQRDENATKNLLEYEKYTKVGKIYIHNSYIEKNNSSKSQAELSLDNFKKLPESGGEVKTVEKCKSQIINYDNLSNFSEAVNANLH